MYSLGIFGGQYLVHCNHENCPVELPGLEGSTFDSSRLERPGLFDECP